MQLEYMLKELKGKSAQPVPRGNHNLFETSAVCSVQKGKQTFPLPIDP